MNIFARLLVSKTRKIILVSALFFFIVLPIGHRCYSSHQEDTARKFEVENQKKVQAEQQAARGKKEKQIGALKSAFGTLIDKAAGNTMAVTASPSNEEKQKELEARLDTLTPGTREYGQTMREIIAIAQPAKIIRQEVKIPGWENLNMWDVVKATEDAGRALVGDVIPGGAPSSSVSDYGLIGNPLREISEKVENATGNVVGNLTTTGDSGKLLRPIQDVKDAVTSVWGLGIGTVKWTPRLIWMALIATLILIFGLLVKNFAEAVKGKTLGDIKEEEDEDRELLKEVRERFKK